jgi:hypothetical protein
MPDRRISAATIGAREDLGQLAKIAHEADAACRHDSEDEFRSGTYRAMVCMACNAVTEMHPINRGQQPLSTQEHHRG